MVPSSEIENGRMKWKFREEMSLVLFLLNVKWLWRQRIGNTGLYFRREVWARDTHLKIIGIHMGVDTLRMKNRILEDINISVVGRGMWKSLKKTDRME